MSFHARSSAGGDPWEYLRRKALEQFERHLEEGRVDEDIVDLLRLVNNTKNCYTTSSCSGRIQVSCGEHPGAKGRLVVVAKWHRTVSLQELVSVLDSLQEESVWLSVHPPIFHVVARDLSVARKLLAGARNSGFKHSGIQGLGRRVVVEIMSMERLEVPIRVQGVEVVRRESLPILLETANEFLLRGKSRLGVLRKVFTEACD
ncbi:tRNA(Phe) 7-((3-amino-3-carboxypropyl)-4-demethylwyosine(37)-N(4))-methyltransferase [Thermofilum pendens]|uniref:tRNA(Phe) 7-((3-amino-3-carboxypropyl)-4-demethylwyosine(37)-N(4))-methyltransferase n=1 Tax=Thermofilum pendens (strain DSM 2475 / Hrk 5) TaxID=368408 RepID=A1RWF5_THEPD|nr:hypothetical protein [Thermofilum pendens]ABL77535.1 Protein of unknown function DUF207 [Thermofilum pendens Hrk 5]